MNDEIAAFIRLMKSRFLAIIFGYLLLINYILNLLIMYFLTHSITLTFYLTDSSLMTAYSCKNILNFFFSRDTILYLFVIFLVFNVFEPNNGLCFCCCRMA